MQKSGNTVRVNVQLIKGANDSHLWADTFDRKLTDIFSVESEVAKAIADQIADHLTVRKSKFSPPNPQIFKLTNASSWPRLQSENGQHNRARYWCTEIPEKSSQDRPENSLFSSALFSIVNARGYISQSLQPKLALREEARQAAETAAYSPAQPRRGHVGQRPISLRLSKGLRHGGALLQALQFLPNNSQIPASLAYVARRRGQWDPERVVTSTKPTSSTRVT